MRAVTYSEFRSKLGAMMDMVNDDHAPLIVTRTGGKSVVVISLDDYSAHEETACLLASPANAAELLASIAEIERGGGKKRELIE